MPEQHLVVSSTTIIVAAISIVGFIVTGLISVVGGLSIFMINRWVKKSDEKELAQKLEREEAAKQRERDKDEIAKQRDADKLAYDDRMLKTANVFGEQLKEFMVEIKEVKKSVAEISVNFGNLANAFANSERESTARHKANEKRLDEHHDELGKLRTARHESDQVQTRIMVGVETNTRNIDNIKRENEQIRADGFSRIAALENKVFKQNFGGVPKVK